MKTPKSFKIFPSVLRVNYKFLSMVLKTEIYVTFLESNKNLPFLLLFWFLVSLSSYTLLSLKHLKNLSLLLKKLTYIVQP